MDNTGANNVKGNNLNKIAYIAPALTKIKLVAGEAVLATCKLGNSINALCDPDISCISTPRS